MKVLSFGAGLQTSAMLEMAIEGLIERPDLVIFADTQSEPKSVYESLKKARSGHLTPGLSLR